MKLVSFTVDNFRAYREPTKLSFDDLTTVIGRNDIGKSSVLEALEIFFNNDVVKIDQGDANVFSGSPSVGLTAEFADIPASLTLDEGAPTTLAAEHLLSVGGTLIIEKRFDCSKKTVPVETFILARHPTAKGVENLLDLKEKELQAKVKERGLQVALKGNPGMRAALWGSEADLGLADVRIAVAKTKEDAKRIWEQLEAHLPIFALFQSDRQSKDTDGEVQNPLKGAIATAIAEAQQQIEQIQDLVRVKAEEIAKLTHAALSQIDPALAGALSPRFTPPSPSKWNGLFSLGMETDDGVPLNKRGSGVRRLILVSFFKAEAERRLRETSRANIIYAIEEPETSQHPNNQRILVRSLMAISATPNTQVILTTHSPGLAAELPVDSIRYVSCDVPKAAPVIASGADVFGEVADALGLTPDSRVRVLVCVEGPTDVEALGYLSAALHADDRTIPNLRSDSRFAFVVLGGSVLKHWVNKRYLGSLGLPEVHIYDSDVADYAASVANVNGRGDGSWAVQTRRYEIECYLHPGAIQDGFGITIVAGDDPRASAILPPFCQAYSADRRLDPTMKHGSAKTYFVEKAWPLMTAARVRDRDPQGEVESWFRRLAQTVR